MSLYDRLVRTPKGARALASARLRYEVLEVLHKALARAGISQAELADRLGVRKSAVNQVLRGDGNVRISTLAEYLSVLGLEAELRTVVAGKPREEAKREMRQAWMQGKAVRDVRSRSRLVGELGNVEWTEVARTGASEIRVASKSHTPQLRVRDTLKEAAP